MSLVLAVIPILIVLIGIIFLKKPAWICSADRRRNSIHSCGYCFFRRDPGDGRHREKRGHISLAGCIPGMGSIRAAGTDAGQHRREPDQDDSQFFDQGQARADRPDSFSAWGSLLKAPQETGHQRPYWRHFSWGWGLSRLWQRRPA